MYNHFYMYRNNEPSLMFKALGDPTRLRIFEFLKAQCCPVAVETETGAVSPLTGPTVGEVCCHVTGEAVVTSTVSFHLKELRQAGLITMERSGRHMICGVNQDAVAQLIAMLSASATVTRGSDCCK
jgi:ArsR family transcriptional regulator